MKKMLILFIFLLANISSTFAFSISDCQLATPRYGVIQCINTMQKETNFASFSCDDEWCTAEIPCLSNCKLNSRNDIQIEGCPIGYSEKVEIYKDGDIKSYPLEWDVKTTATVRATCALLFGFGGYKTIDSGSRVEYQQDLIKLYEGWAGTLPTKPLDYTEGCSLNKIASKYHSDIDVQLFLDPKTGITEDKPSSTYTSINEMPTNWKIGNNYVFVKDWMTGVADISLTYDKNNNAYWCGGTLGNRKIYNVENVNSGSGNCYAIPKSVAKQNIECCFPVDCSWKGPQYTCNPDTWNCEETRWCDSELDCQQVFGEGVCQNEQIISWSCIFNKKWGVHSGTCEKKTKAVIECPDACTSAEYYNEEEGICKPRIEYIDCPPGKCCVGGSSYKPRICSSDMICCKLEGSYVGECKTECIETNDKNIEEEKLIEFGKKYEKIWRIDNFKINID